MCAFNKESNHKCNVIYYLLKFTRLFFPYFLANRSKPSTFVPPISTNVSFKALFLFGKKY